MSNRPNVCLSMMHHYSCAILKELEVKSMETSQTIWIIQENKCFISDAKAHVHFNVSLPDLPEQSACRYKDDSDTPVQTEPRPQSVPVQTGTNMHKDRKMNSSINNEHFGIIHSQFDVTYVKNGYV